MRTGITSRLFLTAALTCALPNARAAHTIPCTDPDIQTAIDFILYQEKNNGGADGIDYYIQLGGGLVFNEPVVIDETAYGIPGGAVIQIDGGLTVDPSQNNCVADNPVFDGSETVLSGGGRFSQSVVQIKGNATVYVHRLTLSGANLSGSGGGISFDGTGSLNLYGVDIANNTAGSGAGIHANGSAPGLALTFHDWALQDGTQAFNRVENNTATNGSGGGVDLSGETFLYATDGKLIVGPNTASSNGGGIAMRGHGSMQLQNALIGGNTATNGGGIFVNPDASTEVYFYDDVRFSGNTATDQGGGIYIGNSTHLHADSVTAATQVLVNHVTSSSGCGGGIFVGAPATMTFTGSVTHNDSAGDGGGICGKSGTGDSDVTITLSGVSPQSPVAISDNSAANRGGGIYCRAYEGGVLSGINLCNVTAEQFSFDRNSAAEGTALFGRAESDLTAFSRKGPSFILKGACGGTPGCNEINGNFRSATADTSAGSTIYLEELSYLNAANVKFQHNQGAHLLYTPDDYVSFVLNTTLITDNQTDAALIDAGSSTSDVSARDTTFAQNTVGTTIIRSPVVSLHNDIFAELNYVADFVDSTGPQNISDVLTGSLDSTLSSQATGTVFLGSPQFVDPANGDYHLAPYSLGIDAGAASIDPNTQFPVDLDGKTRDVDVGWVDNMDGPRDLGAYEFNGVLPPCSAPDKIFCSQFE